MQDEALDSLPPSITRLDLSFCGELADRALAHLAARLPALASLTLRKCGRLTDSGLAALAGATALTHLDLSYCQFSAAGLAALRPLRHLASLALIDCMRAASPPAMMLLTQLPALESLDLSDNQRLDDGSMQVRQALGWGCWSRHEVGVARGRAACYAVHQNDLPADAAEGPRLDQQLSHLP